MNETARNSCVTLAACAGALLSAVIPAHPQTDGMSVDQAVLQAVALLVHALYDDEPYEFIYTSSGTAIVAVKKERSSKGPAALVWCSNSKPVASAKTFSIPEMSASKT